MSSPRRMVKGWWNQLRMREVIRDVEWELSLALKHTVRLTPVRLSGGFDCIYLAKSRRHPSLIVASVRLNCPWRDRRPEEPDLPRRPLAGPQRIVRESNAYRTLAEHRASPKLLVQGTNYLANEWLALPRMADVLRHDESLIWDILPCVFRSIRTAHALEVTHLDLNCGNVLVDSARGETKLIDFEYAPNGQMTRQQFEAFDLLRLVHNLLKPRRGRQEILKHPDRFFDLMDVWLPASCAELIQHQGTRWFSRIGETEEFVRRLGSSDCSRNALAGGKL